jgi:hypothetical protein
MFSEGAAVISIAIVPLALGTMLYRFVESRPWPDSFLNAAMLLGGMGPVDRLETTAGKWLAGIYALFCGLFFIVLAGVMLAPVLHLVLQRFHLEQGDGSRSTD